MVFFTCNACGQTVKKSKVEKHYQTECRDCAVLSCLDCGKDFHGDDYALHTSCISEAEKYQGKLYKDSNRGQPPKGEKKQQAWLEVSSMFKEFMITPISFLVHVESKTGSDIFTCCQSSSCKVVGKTARVHKHSS